MTLDNNNFFFCRSTSDPNIGEELQKHIEAPYFIPPGLSHLDLSWIFMGAPGPGASIHVSFHNPVHRLISVFQTLHSEKWGTLVNSSHAWCTWWKELMQHVWQFKFVLSGTLDHSTFPAGVTGMYSFNPLCHTCVEFYPTPFCFSMCMKDREAAWVQG